MNQNAKIPLDVNVQQAFDVDNLFFPNIFYCGLAIGLDLLS